MIKDLTQEEMSSISLKTSQGLTDKVVESIKEMNLRKLDELKFTLPNTKVSLILLRKGSESEEKRKDLPAVFFGVEYRSGSDIFILSRK